MKSRAAIVLPVLISLVSLLASCRVPTTTIPGIQTIWWQPDDEGAIRFATNDDRHCDHSFMTWGDSLFDPFQRLDVEVRKKSGNAWGGYGLLFCVRDAENHYLLDISTAGCYAILKVVSGSWSTIMDWTFTPLLNQGYDVANRLQVSYEGASSTFTVTFNGSVVTEFVDADMDGGYNGYFAEVGPQGFEHFPSFPVDVRFKDRVAVSVTPAGGLVTTEAGGTAAFSIVLETQPGADVVVPMSTSDATEGSVNPASVTFTAGNWAVPQSVIVTGVDDGLTDGDQAYAILTGSAVSGDPVFSGLDPLDVPVVNRDNEQFKVQPPHAQGYALFGNDVAIDGGYAVVGANGEAGGGAVYVYRQVGTNTWDAGVRITPPDLQEGDCFGSAVAVSGDYTIVGAPGEDDGGTNAGAAYIFHRTGPNTWDYGAKLVAADSKASDAFGVSVGIGGDYAIAGASFRYEGAARAGAAYVFHRTASNSWDPGTKIVPPDGGYDQQFGNSVGVNGDYLVVGARYDSETASGAGAAYVFHRTDTNAWDSVTKIMAADGQTHDNLGTSVAIDGDYVIAGAPGYQGGTGMGAAYVFHRTDTNTWDAGTKILAADAHAADRFGCSVGISGDRVIAGATGVDAAGGDEGAAYIFLRTGTNTWDSGTRLLTLDLQYRDQFGVSAGISGSRAIVGAGQQDQGLIDAGGAYLYPVP